MLERDDAQPLLGRARELELIDSLLDGIGSRGQALLLRGAPGIGKSRLLSEAAARAQTLGMTLLTATGVQSETRLPFAGLHQLLRPVRKRIADLPEVHRNALDAAFGLTHKPAPEHFRVAMATLDLLAEIAGDRPLLVVVDDVHWIDPPTTDVLAFVARRIESDPIVLLGAAREGYPATPLNIAGLREHNLYGLDEPMAASLLDAAAPQLPPPSRARVLREAAGNPLALLELPATSQIDGELPVLPLSERLERAFAGRVAELPEETRLVLLAAACDDGDRAGEILTAAGAVAGRPLALDALEPARAAALVDVAVDTIRFRHPLMRSAVWQSAGSTERRRVHEALAELLHGDPDRRVWHRAALVTGTHEELARELEAAGVRAYRRGAIDVALAALRRAVQLSDPGRRATQALAAAELAFERGRPDLAVPLMRDLDIGELEPRDAGRAWILRENLQSGALTDHARVRDLIAIAERAGDRDVHHNLLWLVATRTWWADPPAATRRLVVEAADRAGPPTAADPRLVAIHAYADSSANAARVIDCLRAAAASRPPIDDAPGYLASAGLICGAFEESLGFSAAAVERARADGRLGALPRLLAVLAMNAVRFPYRDLALPAAEEARRLALELNQQAWLAAAETVIATLAAIAGDRAEAERATARAEEIARSLGARHFIALAQNAPGLVALGEARYDEALRLRERLLDPADPAYHAHFACSAIADLAEAAVLAGDPEAGRRRLAQIESQVGTPTNEWHAMHVRHARAVLADDDEQAAARFRDAFDAGVERWPFWHGRLLLAHGRWLRRSRHVQESRISLRAARDRFDALGAVGWSERARSELRASGETSRRRDPSTRDDLTAQELQIAQLAASGLSNREIGQRLYLSHRTISTHLYRVFPKLGITSRAELAAALASRT